MIFVALGLFRRPIDILRFGISLIYLIFGIFLALFTIMSYNQAIEQRNIFRWKLMIGFQFTMLILFIIDFFLTELCSCGIFYQQLYKFKDQDTIKVAHCYDMLYYCRIICRVVWIILEVFKIKVFLKMFTYLKMFKRHHQYYEENGKFYEAKPRVFLKSY